MSNNQPKSYFEVMNMKVCDFEMWGGYQRLLWEMRFNPEEFSRSNKYKIGPLDMYEDLKRISDSKELPYFEDSDSTHSDEIYEPDSDEFEDECKNYFEKHKDSEKNKLSPDEYVDIETVEVDIETVDSDLDKEITFCFKD